MKDPYTLVVVQPRLKSIPGTGREEYRFTQRWEANNLKEASGDGNRKGKAEGEVLQWSAAGERAFWHVSHLFLDRTTSAFINNQLSTKLSVEQNFVGDYF